MLPINSAYNKSSGSIYHDKEFLKYHVTKKSLNGTIRHINQLSCNNSYNLSLCFNEPIDYIDLSLINDSVEFIEINYNSNYDMNKMVMISCENKKNLKEITFNFNTQEKRYCVIINCSSNIIIKGGKNVFTYVNTSYYLSIRAYNTNSICISDSCMDKLELEKIEDLTLSESSYIKNSVRNGPITENIRHIDKLSIENIEKYLGYPYLAKNFAK